MYLSQQDLTQMLLAWSDGEGALDRLIRVVYEELRRGGDSAQGRRRRVKYFSRLTTEEAAKVLRV